MLTLLHPLHLRLSSLPLDVSTRALHPSRSLSGIISVLERQDDNFQGAPLSSAGASGTKSSSSESDSSTTFAKLAMSGEFQRKERVKFDGG